MIKFLNHYLVKEVNHKRVHTIECYLYDISGKNNLYLQKASQWLHEHDWG